MTAVLTLLVFIFGGASVYFALTFRRSENSRKLCEQENVVLKLEFEKIKIESSSRIESLNALLADLRLTNEKLGQKIDEASRQTIAAKEENSALTARIRTTRI